jgi:light-independent protochlorophyllide reductase subunit B
VPIGVKATREFIAEVAALAGIAPDQRRRRRLALDLVRAVGRRQLPDRQARVRLRRRQPCHRRRAVAAEEFGFQVVGLGSYSREFARELRAAAARYGVEP